MLLKQKFADGVYLVLMHFSVKDGFFDMGGGGIIIFIKLKSRAIILHLYRGF